MNEYVAINSTTGEYLRFNGEPVVGSAAEVYLTMLDLVSEANQEAFMIRPKPTSLVTA